MRICVLGSGSRGNSTYVEANGTSLLIDTGFYVSRTRELLNAIGTDVQDLHGILITHEHSDHVIGLSRIMKHSDVPVYMSSGTYQGLKTFLPDKKVNEFEHGTEFRISDIAVRPFSVLHDAADPSGFILETDGRKAGIVTDVGHVTTSVREYLKGCNTILLESNHDEERLMRGRYPWYLKQRILSKEGHLSNIRSARTVEEVTTPELHHVVLVHLSQENNTPELAQRAHASFLEKSGIKLSITSQNTMSNMFEV
jgi:phosphoribosyl 1,2-cyclic phosphodiesterase